MIPTTMQSNGVAIRGGTVRFTNRRANFKHFLKTNENVTI